MSAIEEWRLVPSYPGYEASSRGRVREVGGKALRGSPVQGYVRISVTIRGLCTTRGAHELVCDAFHGPAPAGHEVDHGNGARNDNRPSNLEWVTCSENMLRAWTMPGRREKALARGMEIHMRAKRARERRLGAS